MYNPKFGLDLIMSLLFFKKLHRFFLPPMECESKLSDVLCMCNIARDEAICMANLLDDLNMLCKM